MKPNLFRAITTLFCFFLLFNSQAVVATEKIYSNEINIPSYHMLQEDQETFRVNINTADIEELAISLKGVGEKKAQAIISYREKFGSFKKVDDLMKVKGIGPKLVENNRHVIAIDDEKKRSH